MGRALDIQQTRANAHIDERLSVAEMSLDVPGSLHAAKDEFEDAVRSGIVGRSPRNGWSTANRGELDAHLYSSSDVFSRWKPLPGTKIKKAPPISDQAFHQWYLERFNDWPVGAREPSEDDDKSAAEAHFGTSPRRSQLRHERECWGNVKRGPKGARTR